jgi:BCD family chlorophyll transporter-like MFS transporter
MERIKRYLNYLRLAGFPLGYGLTGALIGGTLNRIMIADLEISATLVGLFFALPLLVSPVRVWLGYRSDGFPILGRRREPYILLGAIIAGLGVLGAALVTVRLARSPLGLVAGGALAFLIYGIGRNLGHNTYQALLADTFTGDQRPRAMTGYEVATLLGLVMGAGFLGQALEEYDPGRLVGVAIGVGVIFFVLALIAAVGQERKTGDHQEAVKKAREMPFRQVLQEVVMGDPQVRLFFLLVIFTFVGTLAQDVLLEPYGALVLGMSVGATTRLTAFWGLGVMLSMLLSGVFLIKWFGYMTIMRVGLISSLLVFIGVIVAGLLGNPGLFNGLVLVMGLGTGLAGAGMLTGVINFTTSIRAGLLMGVWGMANLVGRAFGSLMGGGVVDLVQGATGGNAFLAYASVFAIEAMMLLIALGISYRLKVGESRAQVEEAQELQLAAAD